MSRKATGCNAVSGDATSFVNPASTGDPTPTTSAGDSGTDTTSVDSIETGTEPGSSTTADQPEAPPTIVSFDVEPDLVEDNGLIEIEVATENADGVRMALETGEVIELVPGMVGGFIGQIDAFTALDNGEHIAALTPWREGIDGSSSSAPTISRASRAALSASAAWTTSGAPPTWCPCCPRPTVRRPT